MTTLEVTVARSKRSRWLRYIVNLQAVRSLRGPLGMLGVRKGYPGSSLEIDDVDSAAAKRQGPKRDGPEVVDYCLVP